MEMEMYRGLDKAAINRILQRMTLEIGDDPGSWELVQSPRCALDLGSYGLLVKQTGGRSYSEFFTRAVQAIKPVVSFDQIEKAIAVVKRHRRNHSYKIVHTRIGKVEYKWIEDTATKLGVRPSRILEATVFFYLRAEDQVSAGEN